MSRGRGALLELDQPARVRAGFHGFKQTEQTKPNQKIVSSNFVLLFWSGLNCFYVFSLLFFFFWLFLITLVILIMITVLLFYQI